MEKHKVAESGYIKENKASLRELVSKLTEIYGYASALAVDSVARTYRVQRSGITASDEPMLCTRGAVVRVFAGGVLVEYSTDEIGFCHNDRIIKEIAALTDGMERCACPYSERHCVLDESTEYETDPESLSDKEIIGMLSKARDKAMSADSRVFDAALRYSYRKYTKFFCSPTRDMTESIMWSAATVLAMTKNGERIKDSYKSASGLGGAEIIKALSESKVDEAVACAIDLLDSSPLPAGEYDCICAPDVTGLIVHEAFGHGVEMDMFVKDRALAEKYVGGRVASSIVCMHDTASGKAQAASYFFDDEGNLSTDTVIIDRGILKCGISDAMSAHRTGTLPTGNGRRESFSHKAYTRMTNTYFEGGDDSLSDMISSIEYGFLLEEARCGMEDPKNWGIQCVAGIAREIKDGELTGKVYSPAVMSGYVPDLLCSVSMASERVELFGSGFCGKGYKEWVKVSDGGPYIKARIKLS